MKKGFLRLCVLVAAALLLSSAYAESKHGILNFTIGAGYERFATKRHLDNTAVPFLALGYTFTSHLGIEGMLGTFNSRSTSTAGANRTVHGKLFALDGVFHFLPYKAIEPYVMLGLGVLGLSYNNTNPNNEANVNGAIGLQYFAAKQVSLRIEARDFYTMVGGKNDIMLDAGVNFLFDMG